MTNRHVLIIGAGVVGLSLAAELGRRPEIEVTVVDRAADGELPRSTGHAPGFLGLYHDVPVLTELARQTAARYEGLGAATPARPGPAGSIWPAGSATAGSVPGFARVGGLEVAVSPGGLAEIERRAAAASAADLPARMLEPAEAATVAPHLVDPGQCVGAAHYTQDATAETHALAAALRAQATARGVRFRSGVAVTELEITADRARGLPGLPADDVVVACGPEGPAVAALAGVTLPLTPVAHPYVHGPSVGAYPAAPFVRWPERRVYARAHADRLGLGTADHRPVAVRAPSADTDEDWLPDPFDAALDAAMALLPTASRFTPERRVNGIVAMTADTLPLLGAAPGVDGLWLAEAISLTHAAGAAEQLAHLMTGTGPTLPDLALLRPDRFAGQDPAVLEARALTLYRDIAAVGA